MKGLFWGTLIFALGLVFLAAPVAVMAQAAPTAAGNAPIAQPLIREGDLALKLVDALQLGAAADETEAESTLSEAGISPKNGWIADYPVTPDIIGELQASISEAADSGKLPMGRDKALAAFQEVLAGYDLPLKAAGAGEAAEPAGETYSDTTIINNYYYNEGPPVVTYYAPPPDYAYLYTWVPYPFWWWDFWYPGFFVLVDFDIVVRPGHFHHHGHRAFISNHFHDRRAGRIFRIDPTSRARGGFFRERTRRGPRSVPPSFRGRAEPSRGHVATRPPPGTRPSTPERRATRVTRPVPQGKAQQFRGYGTARRPSPGTRSSAFERWGSSRFDGAASDRGFRSRSNAGQLPERGFAPGRVPSSGEFRVGGGSRGFHGGGRFRR